jgi:hypothetical protein
MGGFTIEIPKPLDVLDAEVDKCLSGLCDLERKDRTRGSVQYKAKDKEGYLFGVILRKTVDDSVTKLHIIHPPPEANDRAKPILSAFLFGLPLVQGLLPNPVVTELDIAAYANVQLPDAGEQRLPHPDQRRRRVQVRQLWQEGLTDNEIARRLSVSPGTVKNDRKELGLQSKPRKQ